jgi:hypothetical protein
MTIILLARDSRQLPKFSLRKPDRSLLTQHQCNFVTFSGCEMPSVEASTFCANVCLKWQNQQASVQRVDSLSGSRAIYVQSKPNCTLVKQL